MLVEFSKKDIKRNTILTPAYYKVRVEGHEAKLAAKQDSTNHMVELCVLQNMETGDTEECADVPVMAFFNSKAIGMAIPFINAIANSPEEEITEAGQRFDFDAAQGRMAEVLIKPELRDNNMQNSVTNQWRKQGAAS